MQHKIKAKVVSGFFTKRMFDININKMFIISNIYNYAARNLVICAHVFLTILMSEYFTSFDDLKVPVKPGGKSK